VQCDPYTRICKKLSGTTQDDNSIMSDEILSERWSASKFLEMFTDFFSSWKTGDIRDYIELMGLHANYLGDEISAHFNEFFFFPIFRETGQCKTRASWVKWLQQFIGEFSSGEHTEDYFVGIKNSVAIFFEQTDGEAMDKMVDPTEFEHLVEHLVAEHGVLIVEQLMHHLKVHCMNEEPKEDSVEKSEVGIRLASTLDTFFGEKELESAIQFNCLIEDEIEIGENSDENSAILSRLKFPGSIRLLTTKSLSKRELLSHFLNSVDKVEICAVIEILERLLHPISARSSNHPTSAKSSNHPISAKSSKTGGTENRSTSEVDGENQSGEKKDRVQIEDLAIESMTALCQFQSFSITSVCINAVSIMNDAFDQIYSAKSHKGRIALIEMISSPGGDGEDAVSQKLLRCVACDISQESSLYGSALSEHGLDYSIIECSPEELAESQEDLLNFVATQLKDEDNVIGVLGFDVGIQGHSTKDDIKFIEVCREILTLKES
jgi:hypothetical protein